MKKLITIMISLVIIITMCVPAHAGTIYEDVEALTERVATLENTVESLKTKELTENTDLFDLSVGRYYVPSAAVSATLSNKPTTSNATAYIEVLPGGNSGQLIMRYMPCASSASYYQIAYYSGAWDSWKAVNLYDSGWIDLPLSGNVTAYNDEQKPRYRRIGNEVFITGVVKNISEFETVISTLPVNYRPSKKVIIAVPSIGTKFSRISISTNGEIYYERSSDNTINSTNWHSLACSFYVD